MYAFTTRFYLQQKQNIINKLYFFMEASLLEAPSLEIAVSQENETNKDSLADFFLNIATICPSDIASNTTSFTFEQTEEWAEREANKVSLYAIVRAELSTLMSSASRDMDDNTFEQRYEDAKIAFCKKYPDFAIYWSEAVVDLLHNWVLLHSDNRNSRLFAVGSQESLYLLQTVDMQRQELFAQTQALKRLSEFNSTVLKSNFNILEANRRFVDQFHAFSQSLLSLTESMLNCNRNLIEKNNELLQKFISKQ